jgi:hypothetical protein
LTVWTLSAWALPNGWNNYSGASKKHTFTIHTKNITVDGSTKTMKLGDAIAVFEVTDTSRNCLGFAILGILDTDSLRVTATKDTVKPFTKNASYSFVLWDSAQNCQIMLSDSANPRTLIDGAYTLVKKLTGSILKIYYEDRIFTNNEVSVIPINSNITLPVIYTSYSTNLQIDSLSGIVTPNSSTINKYPIRLFSDYCLANIYDTLEFKSPKPVIDSNFVDSLNFEVKNTTCSLKGSIELSNNTLPSDSIYFTLINSITNDTVSLRSKTANWNLLSDGNYTIIANYKTNNWIYKNNITILNQCILSNDIIDVNTNKLLHIQQAGVVKIFNRDGILVSTFQSPNTWAGQDKSGNNLPLGDYYIYLNDSAFTIVTILR